MVTSPISIENNIVYLFSLCNEFNLSIIESLQSHYAIVKAFSDTDSFDQAVHKQMPDVAILDIDSAYAKTLKSQLAKREIKPFPVIYLSREDNFKDRLEAVKEAADGYLLFPIDTVALCKRIDDSISKVNNRSYRVLVVDDDDFFLNFADTVLRSEGMLVQTLQDPTKIIESINRFKPEIIVTDLYMPECSGLEMAKIIRQNDNYLDIPIVFISSENALQDHIDALELGADDFLTKPIDHETLISFISAKAERFRSLRKH